MNTEQKSKGDKTSKLKIKSEWKSALILFVISLALYFLNWILFPEITPDGFLYLELAKNIPDVGYTVLGELHQKFLPLYPALMALGNLLTFDALGEDIWGWIISMTSGAMLPPLFFLLALKLGAKRRSALALASIQIIMYVGLHQYRDINVMPIFTALLALCLYKISDKKYMTAGIFAGLAATTRYEVYLFIPLFLCGHVLFTVFGLLDMRKNKTDTDIKEEVRREIHETSRVFLRAGIGFVLAASFWWARNLLVYGEFIHTYYMAELTAIRFHAVEITRGFLGQFGPAILIFAAVGIKKIDLKWKIFLTGFIVLYTVLHIWWWWYDHRFLLPLTPFIMVPAALGLDKFYEYLKNRFDAGPLKIWIGAVFITAAPVAVYAALYVIGSFIVPEDVYQKAAKSIRDEPKAHAVIGSNVLMLEYYGERPACLLKEVDKDEDPHLQVLEYYLNNNARLIAWTNVIPADWKNYNFLKNNVPHKTKVKTGLTDYQLIYVPYQDFREKGGKIVLIYSIMVKKI